MCIITVSWISTISEPTLLQHIQIQMNLNAKFIYIWATDVHEHKYERIKLPVFNAKY